MIKIVTAGYGDVQSIEIGGSNPLVFIGDPCAIESGDHSMTMADPIGKTCQKLDMPWVFKSW